MPNSDVNSKLVANFSGRPITCSSIWSANTQPYRKKSRTSWNSWTTLQITYSIHLTSSLRLLLLPNSVDFPVRLDFLQVFHQFFGGPPPPNFGPFPPNGAGGPLARRLGVRVNDVPDNIGSNKRPRRSGLDPSIPPPAPPKGMSIDPRAGRQASYKDLDLAVPSGDLELDY